MTTRARAGRSLLATAWLAFAACHGAVTGRTAPTGGGGGSPGEDPPPVGVPADVASSDVFRAGLTAWRRPQVHGACANCHTADAIDLAFINYTDAVILRRALKQKASVDDARAIVALVHLQRERYGIKRPVDPLAFRPLQPGGEPLRGDTVKQRDVALYDELAELGLLIARPERISSNAMAEKARDQILNLDLRTLRVGFEMNRWTEDSFRGDDHRTLAKWIPEVPRAPKPGREAEWYALHDAYIAEPTPANLWRINDAVDAMTTTMSLITPETGDDAPEIVGSFANKYRAVQIAGHMMRRNDTVFPVFDDADPLTYYTSPDHQSPAPNLNVIHGRVSTFWDIGASGRPIRDSKNYFALPAFVQKKVKPEWTPTRDQVGGWWTVALGQIGFPWFWQGMVYDPTLQFSAGANREEYFHEANHQQAGLDIHDTFMDGVFFVHRMFGNDTRYEWGRPVSMWRNGELSWYDRGACNGTNVGQLNDVPANERDERWERRRLLASNIVRMGLYLHEDYLRTHGLAAEKDTYNACLNRDRAGLAAVERPEERGDVDAVFASMLELVKTATEGYEKLGWSDWAEVQRTAFVPPMKTKPLPFQFPKGGDEPPPAPRGRLYQTQCAGCHGDDAGGAVNEDAEGRPTPIPALAGSKLDYAAFAAVVRAGRGDRGMPWWTPDAISDDDLRALYDAATRP